MRTSIDRGNPLADSSDAPVSDHNPWPGMFAATTRETVKNRLFGKHERISPREALRSYTIGAPTRPGWNGSRDRLNRASRPISCCCRSTHIPFGVTI